MLPTVTRIAAVRYWIVCTPPLVLVNGRGVHGLTRDEYDDLRLTVRRYFAWVDNDHPLDPLASGVAGAQRYDRILTKHHKPAGGYGPGSCSPPEHDADLLALDAIYGRLPAGSRDLLRWRWGGRPRGWSAIATEMQMSQDACYDRWGKLVTRLYWVERGMV